MHWLEKQKKQTSIETIDQDGSILKCPEKCDVVVFVDRFPKKLFSNFETHAASADLALEAERGKEVADKSWSSEGPTRSDKRPGGSHHQTRSQGHPRCPF